jgi:hypothetical protein
MIKKIYFLIFIATIAGACNNAQQSGEAKTDENDANENIAEVTVANFEQMAGDLVGQEVTIKGLVNRTCKHSGKRMFIVADDTEEIVKIEAGENIDAFNAELEGSEVVVNGIVAELRVDEAYLQEWEAEIMIETGEEEHKIHEGNHEGEHNEEGEENMEEEEHGTDIERIEDLRNELKASGKEYLSFFSIECIRFEVLPVPPIEE